MTHVHTCRFYDTNTRYDMEATRAQAHHSCPRTPPPRHRSDTAPRRHVLLAAPANLAAVPAVPAQFST